MSGKILTVVGARPQFVKAAPVGKALREAGFGEVLIHTGQHYDYGMSQVFFDELGIPEPDRNLGIGSGGHGWQTGQMLVALEEVMLQEKPDWVLVYGDTNSTLAGALAAAKLHIPIAHVEAGLRSFNRTMPEEHNRVLADHCADALFCPTVASVQNLNREGIARHVYLVGDVMYDAVLQFAAVARQRSTVLRDLALEPKSYLLATVHRAHNTDDPDVLRGILETFLAIDTPIVFPVHPRTRARIAAFDDFARKVAASRLRLIEPVGYLDMLTLEQNARLVLTDSGGVQKEAYFFGVPCVTLRAETEWVETVSSGWNTLVGMDRDKIIAQVNAPIPTETPPPIFGDGTAARRIADCLRSFTA